jgi:hypothetical protein
LDNLLQQLLHLANQQLLLDSVNQLLPLELECLANKNQEVCLVPSLLQLRNHQQGYLGNNNNNLSKQLDLDLDSRQ